MSQWATPESYVGRARRRGLAGPARRSRTLSSYPAWRVSGDRLVREWRFKDSAAACGFVERLTKHVNEFGRRPDICMLRGNRVRVTVMNPNHAGVTVAELRTVGQVEAIAQRYGAESASAASGSALPLARVDSHEHPLGA